jgi:hypothetical protein
MPFPPARRGLRDHDDDHDDAHRPDEAAGPESGEPAGRHAPAAIASSSSMRRFHSALPARHPSSSVPYRQ